MKIIVAIIGKAGSGKDTIQNELCKRNPEYHGIVSCTTRPIREGEMEGVNYFYLTKDEFAKKVYNGDMLEATVFNDWCYGTMKSSLHDGVNVGVFNPEGYDNLCSTLPDDVKVVGFFIDVNDKTRLLRQLNREEHPDVHEIVRRFGTDEADFEGLLEDFPELYVLNNETQDDLLINLVVIQNVVNCLAERV